MGREGREERRVGKQGRRGGQQSKGVTGDERVKGSIGSSGMCGQRHSGREGGREERRGRHQSDGDTSGRRVRQRGIIQHSSRLGEWRHGRGRGDRESRGQDKDGRGRPHSNTGCKVEC